MLYLLLGEEMVKGKVRDLNARNKTMIDAAKVQGSLSNAQLKDYLDNKFKQHIAEAIAKEDKGIKKLILEAQRSTRFALLAIGFAIIGLTFPSIIKLTELEPIGEWIFVVLYFGIGIWILVSEGLKLKAIKDGLEKLK